MPDNPATPASRYNRSKSIALVLLNYLAMRADPVNSIRPGCLASLLGTGEAQTRLGSLQR